MAKLTRAQITLLSGLPTSCVFYYPPAKKLVDLGLAKWANGSPGGRLVITDAGRRALSEGDRHG